MEKPLVNYRKLPKHSSQIIYACSLESCLAVNENPYLTVQSLILSPPGSGVGMGRWCFPGASPRDIFIQQVVTGVWDTLLHQVIRNLSAEDCSDLLLNL